jgi:secernin
MLLFAPYSCYLRLAVKNIIDHRLQKHVSMVAPQSTQLLYLVSSSSSVNRQNLRFFFLMCHEHLKHIIVTLTRLANMLLSSQHQGQQPPKNQQTSSSYPLCGCDTFVAFPPATPPGMIVFGKNSDRPAGEGQTIRRYPRKTYHDSSSLTPSADIGAVQCTYISIDQVPTTNAVLLSQIDWMFGAEMGANEYGVVIGNEAIWTKDDCSSEPKFLLGMDLVRLGLERGNSAKEALDVITTLLETHGQGGGCAEDDPTFTYHNSFMIVDQTEAFVLETSGRHWVAERITEGVRNISNCLSIRSNYDFCSDGIQEYALKRGYWKRKPDKDDNDDDQGKIDFASVFSTSGRANVEMSDTRFCGGRRLLEEYSNNGTMNKDAMITILRDHTSGICMHGGFETTSSWVSELYMANNDNQGSNTDSKKVRARHWVTRGPYPCERNFEEERVI